MNLTKIIFILSTYLITFSIVSFVRGFLKSPSPKIYDGSKNPPFLASPLFGYLAAKEQGRKRWRDYLHALFIILPNLFISAIFTYFIYKLYPFEPTMPNIFTIAGSLFGVFMTSYFVYKSLKKSK